MTCRSAPKADALPGCAIPRQSASASKHSRNSRTGSKQTGCERLKQFRMRWQESGDLTYLGKALVDAVVEIERYREALAGIRLYCNDTLSGRADGGPDDRAWQREAVVEVRNRARSVLEDRGQGLADATPSNPLSEGRERS